MSITLLLFALFITSYSCYLFIALQKLYNVKNFNNKKLKKNPLLNVLQGFFEFYKVFCLTLSNLRNNFLSKKNSYTLLLYLNLNLLIPAWGLGFFINSDGNYIIVILSIFASMRLYQASFNKEESK